MLISGTRRPSFLESSSLGWRAGASAALWQYCHRLRAALGLIVRMAVLLMVPRRISCPRSQPAIPIAKFPEDPEFGLGARGARAFLIRTAAYACPASHP